MNKIEEIFVSKYPENFEVENIYACMKEFGKICFDAGGETEDDGTMEGLWKYKTYEDFLKEIEDETGN